jgi:hypothetical protein
MKSFILPLLALPLAGCFFGKKMDDRTWATEAVAKVQPGKTTKAEVLTLLGPPKEIIRLLESEAYVYSRAVEKNTSTYLVLLNLSRSDRQYDAVTVIIDRKDMVTAVGSRFAADTAEYGFPWE